MSKKGNKKIVVKTWVEAALAEISGFDWSFPDPSPEFVPGLGHGATDEATRWAFIGYRADLATRAYASLLIRDDGQVGPDSMGEILKRVEGSERAYQLVLNGLLYEMQLVLNADEAIAKQKKKSRGRPKNGRHALADKDSQRAFHCWHLLRVAVASGFEMDFDPSIGVTATNRFVIDKAITAENFNPKIFSNKPVFTRDVQMTSLEESVSRGKAKLQIDENWRSELCEKIRLNL